MGNVCQAVMLTPVKTVEMTYLYGTDKGRE